MLEQPGHEHITVFLITGEEFRCGADELELQYACLQRRARCFAVYDDSRSRPVQNYDPPIYNAIAKALVETCDVIAVTGGRVSQQMVTAVKYCGEAGKKVYVEKNTRSILEKALDMGGIHNVVLYDSLAESIAEADSKR